MKTATLLDHQPEDEERMWVAAVCAGEARAFEYLMRRYNRRLYRAARSILRDDAEAEDALQEAYWKAYQAMPGFQFASSLSTWLTRIVINESLSRLRRSRRRPEVIPLDETMEMDRTRTSERYAANREERPDALAWRAEIRHLIERKLDTLPVAYRLVFVLRAVEEVPATEVAQLLDIPEATVRTRYFRARALMRQAMEREVDHHARNAFSFDGERCDRIVTNVLDRLEASRS